MIQLLESATKTLDDMLEALHEMAAALKPRPRGRPRKKPDADDRDRANSSH